MFVAAVIFFLPHPIRIVNSTTFSTHHPPTLPPACHRSFPGTKGYTPQRQPLRVEDATYTTRPFASRLPDTKPSTLYFWDLVSDFSDDYNTYRQNTQDFWCIPTFTSCLRLQTSPDLGSATVLHPKGTRCRLWQLGYCRVWVQNSINMLNVSGVWLQLENLARCPSSFSWVRKQPPSQLANSQGWEIRTYLSQRRL